MKTFPYKGYYDPNLDEYIPDCKICYGEGWICSSEAIIACKCNPEELPPRPD
jgi:hypothetical protein